MKESFISIRKGSFISGLLFLLVAITNYFVFGLEGGRYPPLGSTLGFQGQSWFVAGGLLPLLVGVIMLGISLLQIRKISISNLSESQELTIEEKYWWMWQKSISIQINQIKAISITNTNSHRRNLLILIFLPYFWLVIGNGLGNFFLPQLVGFPWAGFTLVCSGILSLIALIIYIILNPVEMQIQIPTGSYFLLFDQTQSTIQKTLISPICTILEKPNGASSEVEKINSPMNYRKVIVGIVFFLAGALNFLLLSDLGSFLSGIMSLLLISSGLYLLNGGIHQKSLFYTNKVPTNYPFLLKESIFFEFYHSQQNPPAFTFEKEFHLSIWDQIFYNLLNMVIFWHVISLLIGIISNPIMFWRLGISIILLMGCFILNQAGYLYQKSLIQYIWGDEKIRIEFQKRSTSVKDYLQKILRDFRAFLGTKHAAMYFGLDLIVVAILFIMFIV